MVLSAGAEIEPHDLPIFDSESEARPDVALEGSYHQAVLNFKRDLLRSVLTQVGGNQTRAAEVMGLQRTYLSRLLKELDIRNSLP